MTDTGPQDPAVAGEPTIGLATYDVHDPYGTFRTIEPAPPPPRPAPARALLWPLRFLAAWLANLGALELTGLVVTNVSGIASKATKGPSWLMSKFPGRRAR